MATSGSTALTFTRDEIITEALEQLGVIEPGQTPIASHVTSMARTLNNMIKMWQSDGVFLHTISRRYLFADTTKREYSLLSTGDRWTGDYARTEIATAAVATDTAIVVDDITGFSDGAAIGIYLDDGTMQWTTINGAPAGSTINLDDALTDDVSVDAVVYSYANTADRPKDLIEAWERTYDQHDTPLQIYTRQEYSTQVLKENTGRPVGVYYDAQVAAPTLFVWPIIEDPRTILAFWVQRVVESFTASGNEVDLPQEAFMALAMNLAFWSMTKMQVPAATAQLIATQAPIAYKIFTDDSAGPQGPLQYEVDEDMGESW